jgi:glutathione S-transferase
MQLELTVDSLSTSPWAMSAFVALTEKGAAFTIRTIDLGAGDQHGALFTERAFTARVPALADGDFVLTESTAITEYLEDAFAAPAHPALYPADLRGRARARQIQAWLRSDLQALRTERDTETVFYGKACAPLTAHGQEAAAKLLRVAGQLLGDGRATLFDAWSLVDLDLAVMLQRLVVNGDPVPQPLKDYAARQWQRPSVQQWRARHAAR